MEHAPLPEDSGIYDPRSPFRRAFDIVYNGISRLEQWRRTDRLDDSDLDARLEARDLASQQLAVERSHLTDLLLATQSDNPAAEADYQRGLESYHTRRAQNIGEKAIFLAAQDERFSGLRTWIHEKRQNYHSRQAQKASRKLSTLQ
jgi:hypothetical protein